MFNSENLKNLFIALGKIAADPKDQLKMTAQKLAELYLRYLEAKKEDVSANHNNMHYMLKNFKGKPNVDDAIVDAICDDVGTKQGQHHVELLKEFEDIDIDLVEFLRTNYRDAKDIQQSLNPINVPSTLVTGFRIITLSPLDFSCSINEHEDLSVIYDVIKDTSQDVTLRLKATKTLVNLGQHLFGDGHFIEDFQLKEALFALSSSCANKIIVSQIIHALSFCQPKNFTHDEISEIIDKLMLTETPLCQSCYYVKCIIAVLNLNGQSEETSRCISALLEVLAVRNSRELLDEDVFYLKQIYFMIERFFIKQLGTQAQKFLYTRAQITKMIDIVSSPNTYQIEEFSKIGILLNLRKLSELYIDDSDLNKIIYLLLDPPPKYVCSLVDIIRKQTRDANIPTLLLKTRIIEKIISDININLDTKQAAINTIYFFLLLFSMSQHHSDIVKLCIDHQIDQKALLFYQNIVNSDFNISDQHIDVLAAELNIFSENTICNYHFLEHTITVLLPQIKHASMRIHILRVFLGAINDYKELFTTHIKQILSTTIDWFFEQSISFIDMLYFINKLLPLANHNNIRYFIQNLNGYRLIKTNLFSQDVGLIKLTLRIIYLLQDEPEVIEDFLSNGPLVLALDKLSQCKEPHIQNYAETLFIHQDLKRAQQYQDEKNFNKALSLYKHVLANRYVSTYVKCAAHFGCATIYRLQHLNNYQVNSYYIDAKKHYEALLILNQNYVDENNNKITDVLMEMRENYLAYQEASRPYVQQRDLIFQSTAATASRAKTVIIPPSSGDKEFDDAHQLVPFPFNFDR